MLGEKLRALRTARGMTQSQLADRLGISASAVGMYEQARREPDNAMLAKLKTVFGVSTDCLLGLAPEERGAVRDIGEVIDEFTEILEEQQGLMFNGQPLSEADREKIVAAIRVAAAVAIPDVNQKERRRE